MVRLIVLNMISNIQIIAVDNRTSESIKEQYNVLFSFISEIIPEAGPATLVTTKEPSYSKGVITELAEFPYQSNKTHAMVIQLDGFPINRKAWNDSFLDSDYIGAPWWYHPHNYNPNYQISSPSYCVGNGGFSLRSIKLCIESKKLLDITNNYEPEDLFICRSKELRDKGFTFAPLHLAHKFSCEDRVYNNHFGFHGKRTYSMNKTIQNIIPEQIRKNLI